MVLTDVGQVLTGCDSSQPCLASAWRKAFLLWHVMVPCSTCRIGEVAVLAIQGELQKGQDEIWANLQSMQTFTCDTAVAAAVATTAVAAGGISLAPL